MNETFEDVQARAMAAIWMREEEKRQTAEAQKRLEAERIERSKAAALGKLAAVLPGWALGAVDVQIAYDGEQMFVFELHLPKCAPIKSYYDENKDGKLHPFEVPCMYPWYVDGKGRYTESMEPGWGWNPVEQVKDLEEAVGLGSVRWIEFEKAQAAFAAELAAAKKDDGGSDLVQWLRQMLQELLNRLEG